MDRRWELLREEIKSDLVHGSIPDFCPFCGFEVHPDGARTWRNGERLHTECAREHDQALKEDEVD